MADGLSHSRKCALDTVTAQIFGAHTDFPVLFTRANLPDEMFDPNGSFKAQADGGDIRFSSDSAGSNLLPCEIVAMAHDSSTGAGDAVVEIWVKLPNVRDTQSDTIYVWYNTSGSDSQPAVTASNGRNAVWTSTYVFVAHMNEDPSGVAPQIIDSTGNYDGTSVGGMTSGDLVAGAFGAGAIDFDGLSDYINLGTDFGITGTQNRTISLWVKSTLADLQTVVNWGTADGSQGEVIITLENNITGFRIAGGYRLFSASGLTNGSWHYLAHILNGTGTGDMAARMDGAGLSVDSTNSATLATTNEASGKIGARQNSGQSATNYTAAVLDEVRIAASALSADWLHTEHANQNDPGAFISVGTPEDVGGGEISVAGQQAGHAHTASSPGLSQFHLIATAGAAHAHVMQEVALEETALLSVAGPSHAQSAEVVQMGVAGALAIQESSLAHVAATLPLFQSHILTEQDGRSAHQAQIAGLAMAGAGAPADRRIGVGAGTVTLSVRSDSRILPITTNR